jgi:hypothetical protein
MVINNNFIVGYWWLFYIILSNINIIGSYFIVVYFKFFSYVIIGYSRLF